MATRPLAMNDAVIKLSKLLDNYYFERLKLVCTGVHVSERMAQEELDGQFGTLFNLLKQSLSSPSEAVLFCCQVLHHLGYNATEYFRSTAESTLSDYDYRDHHPKVDCMLTVLGFADSLRKSDFSIVRTYVCDHTKQSNDRVKTPVDLVNVLFSEEVVSEDDIGFILELAKQFNRVKRFDEYLARQKKRKKIKALAESVSRDGGASHKKVLKQDEKISIEEETPKEQSSRGKVADWLAQTPTAELDHPLDDKCSLYSDRTGTTAAYSVEDTQSTNKGGDINQLVLPKSKDKPLTGDGPFEVKELMKCIQEESLESQWYRVGEELNVGVDFLHEQELKNRTDSYKLEEVLHQWEESGCSELSWDNATRVLESLKEGCD